MAAAARDRVVARAQRELEGPESVAGSQRLGCRLAPVARSLEERAGARRVASLAAEERGLEESLLAHELQDVVVHGSVFVFLVVRDAAARAARRAP